MTEVINNLEQITAKHHSSLVTIGNFDGVHLGHIQVIQKIQAAAAKYHTHSLVIIFEPQPQEHLLALKLQPARITQLHGKIALLTKCRVDYILCLRFDQQLQQLTAKDFIDKILVDKLHIKQLIVGADFRFGKDKQGDFNYLQTCLATQQIIATKVEFVRLNQEKISSTNIRRALAHGDLAHAKRLLGRDFSISGKVVHGSGLGKDLGTPTANIKLTGQKLITRGVFTVVVTSDDNRLINAPAIANIGYRPSISDNQPLLEVHIFDQQLNLYGCNITVIFLTKLRNEEKFNDLAQLKQHIKLDKVAAKEYFVQLATTT